MPATSIKKLLSCKEKNRRKSAKNKTFAMGYVYRVDIANKVATVGWVKSRTGKSSTT